MRVALTGARIFDGTRIVEGQAVVIEDGRIVEVLREGELEASIRREPVEGLLAPGFIDTQVNGGGGVMFNDVRTIEGIRTIASAHRRFGTTGLLPTFITDTRERMSEAVSAMREALAARVPGILGIHVEGPFINPERKGVHNAALYAADGGRGCRHPHLVERGSHDRDARAGDEQAGSRRSTRRLRRSGLRGPLRRRLRHHHGRMPPWLARVYASLQRHAASGRPRSVSGRRGARQR